MNVDGLIKTLAEKIKESGIEPVSREYGVIQTLGDGIVTIKGLDNVKASEMLLFPGDVYGLALNLEEDSIGAVILGDYQNLREGDKVESTGEVLSIPVSDELVGRVVDPLMNPLDGGAPITATTRYPVEKLAPGVMARQGVNQPLQTGITAIDALVPIGRGQRELIIGDRQTGKTTVAVDAILNQKGQNIKCIYVAIGQKKSRVMRVLETFREAGAMEYTTIVLASASDSPALLYLAPYAGSTIGEYFMDKEEDVLIVFDDLTKHATAYREISLLLRRPPGREAYPGDVFYLHSRLLERSCRRNANHGGGSMTALPIIETQGGDVSGYIPTNVISITDGQIFLESSLFNKGIRPAINPGISVSRVGGSAQVKSMKKNAGPMKNAMAQFAEFESFSQFDSDLDPETKATLERGKRLIEVMKQKQYSPMSVGLQVARIFAVNNGFLDGVALEDNATWYTQYGEFMSSAKSELLEKISASWSEEIAEELRTAITEFGTTFSNS
ncbi:MAG: F-type H+-transporting ATPase subunit alpha [Planctomycetota bacterium]|jgi:F-type H+-transporting ATPase subunit alpha